MCEAIQVSSGIFRYPHPETDHRRSGRREMWPETEHEYYSGKDNQVHEGDVRGGHGTRKGHRARSFLRRL